MNFKEFVNESAAQAQNPRARYTGRFFMLLDSGISRSQVQSILRGRAGLNVASSLDFTGQTLNESKLEGADALFYSELGIVLIGGTEGQVEILINESNAGYRVIPELIASFPNEPISPLTVPSLWSIEAVRADSSRETGHGVGVAVLDTGFDLLHPDFIGRTIRSEVFDGTTSAQDGHGHGTHCIGTACGGVDMAGIRYGVASGSSIYAGKVLNNAGTGAQAWILNGMNWATQQGCKVISMSLGSPVELGDQPNPVYARALQEAEEKGALVVMAAGNESRRQQSVIAPVGSPANTGTGMAVAAIDQNNAVADFSCGEVNIGQVVHIAAPGVDIYSSWSRSTAGGRRYRTISGTSMATPHVAGCAALYFERFPNATPLQVSQWLRENAFALQLAASDVGTGLVQAL